MKAFITIPIFVFLWVVAGACGRVNMDPIRDSDAGPGADAHDSDAGATCAVRCGPSSVCCGTGEECVGAACLPACEGARCGAGDAVCCSAGELCVESACTVPGVECIDDVDCPAGEYCDLVLARCLPGSTGGACTYRPPPQEFDLEVGWAWEEGNVASIPLAVQLTDDDADGTVGPGDVTDVIVISFAPDASWLEGTSVPDGRLIALSGGDGSVLWRSGQEWDLCTASSPAAGDLDGDGSVEIVTLAVPGDSAGCPGRGGSGVDTYIVAFSSDGDVVWAAADPLTLPFRITASAFAIADLEGDGMAEVIGNGAVFEYDGTVRFSAFEMTAADRGAFPFAADVDGDGAQEIVTGQGVWRSNGTPLWTLPRHATRQAIIGRVVAGDGPQLVVLEPGAPRQLSILDAATGAPLLGPVSVGEGDTGSLTLADFDGDSRAEVGFAADDGYYMLDFDLAPPYVAWSVPTTDASDGSVGTTVFDFDGDGSAEVLWADECRLRILAGQSGDTLASIDNTSFTAMEYPVVADVDGNGRANVLVVSSLASPGTQGTVSARCMAAGAGGLVTRGVRVLRDRRDNWIAARSIWNQHAYHFDNVGSDGRIPAHPRASWDTHNTFRANRFPNPETVFLAPDLRVVALDATTTGCPGRVTLRARVQNAGQRSAGRDIPVAFHQVLQDGSRSLLGVARLTGPLPPGSAEWAELTVDDPALDADLMLEMIARVDDDGTGTSSINECDEANNESAPAIVNCGLF